MNTNEAKKATSIRLKAGLYERIERMAKKEHRSITNLIELSLEKVFNYNVPNRETIEAIEELDRGEGLHFKSVEELFESI
ncbi:ribbon-helix-helix protein, CopG family [Arachidicoccus soli]|uniref:Ribbon-helix-helix protein, CopG family n=1 Tax=Arachidicoccus soli TaxID=2341117 RepID=A0A386HML9_9BACT|nr:ribbon-helix-helix protein, CopG family [Arachidicoccus soli]AYD47148.1 ribbon-helix-helix protein, CopG family [Arachidicoccus soli]